MSPPEPKYLQGQRTVAYEELWEMICCGHILKKGRFRMNLDLETGDIHSQYLRADDTYQDTDDLVWWIDVETIPKIISIDYGKKEEERMFEGFAVMAKKCNPKWENKWYK